jgi:hypothetical protein
MCGRSIPASKARHADLNVCEQNWRSVFRLFREDDGITKLLKALRAFQTGDGNLSRPLDYFPIGDRADCSGYPRA